MTETGGVKGEGELLFDEPPLPQAEARHRVVASIIHNLKLNIVLVMYLVLVLVNAPSINFTVLPSGAPAPVNLNLSQPHPVR